MSDDRHEFNIESDEYYSEQVKNSSEELRLGLINHLDLCQNIDPETFHDYMSAIARSKAFSLDNLDMLVDRTTVFIALAIEHNGNLDDVFSFCQSGEADYSSLISIGQKHLNRINNSGILSKKIYKIHPNSLGATIAKYNIYLVDNVNDGDLYKVYWKLPISSSIQISNSTDTELYLKILEKEPEELIEILHDMGVQEDLEGLSKDELINRFYSQGGYLGAQAANDIRIHELQQYNQAGLFLAIQIEEVFSQEGLDITKDLVRDYAYEFLKLTDSIEYVFKESSPGITNGYLFLTNKGIDTIRQLEKIKSSAPKGYTRLSEILKDKTLFSESDIELISKYQDISTLYGNLVNVDEFGNAIDDGVGLRVYRPTKRIEGYKGSIVFFNREDILKYIRFKVDLARTREKIQESDEIGILTYELKSQFLLPNGTNINLTTVDHNLRRLGIIIDAPELLRTYVNGLEVRGFQIYNKKLLRESFPSFVQYEQFNSLLEQKVSEIQGLSLQFNYRTKTSNAVYATTLQDIPTKLDPKRLLPLNLKGSNTDYLDHLVEKLGIQTAFDRPRRIVLKSITEIMSHLASMGVEIPELRLFDTTVVHPEIMDAIVLPFLKERYSIEH